MLEGVGVGMALVWEAAGLPITIVHEQLLAASC